ncbi:hypothetical protein JB92DRAFT_210162 [Gautieria morchelliformis]|nr:hypothetical protein JB92DRAFT_210162 [Gautieria morchelliformis]
MPRAIIHTRPDRKLTEFFSTKPRTAPRPGQPIYDGSSPSERQSIISISSDDVNLSPKKSDRESKSIPQHVARDEHSPCLSSLSSISTDEDEADLELDLSTSPKKSDREPKSIPQHVARDEHSPCLSSLSSISTDEDEADLELDLSTFAKGRTVKLTEPSTYSVTPLGVGTRRSARHVDLPAPDYARKLELFRDYRPSSGKGKYDVDGKGKSKVCHAHC